MVKNKVKIIYKERTSNPAIKNLREEIEQIKLKKELDRLKGQDKEESDEDKETRKAKKEMEDLQSKRKELDSKTGFKNFLNKANLNYQINQNRKFIQQKRQLRNLKQLEELKKVQSNVVKSELQLREAKRSLNNTDILGLNNLRPKPIDVNELFK